MLEEVKNHDVKFTKEAHETDPENGQSSVAKNKNAQDAGEDENHSLLHKRTHKEVWVNKSKVSEEKTKPIGTDINDERKSSRKSTGKDNSSKNDRSTGNKSGKIQKRGSK